MTVTPSAAPAKKDNTGIIAGVVVAVVVVLAAVGVGAFFVLRKRRAKRAMEDGGIMTHEGKKYSEMPNSDVRGEGSPAVARRKEVSDARIQGDAELDGGQRYEIQDHYGHEPAQERGPAMRHELGTS